LSLHSQISAALDSLEQRTASPHYEVIVDTLILRAMREEKIDIEDFSYYYGRLTKVCAYLKGVAA
jgi:hypothetical protein